MHYLLHNNVFLFCLILFLQVKATTQAQGPEFVQLNREPEFSMVSGEQQHISLSFLIKEGYHIQANQVKDENLIPTVLSMDTPDGLVLGDPVFPEAVEFRMKGVEEALHVYSNVLEIKVPVQTVKPEEKESFSMNGKLHYQVCDDSKCYFPRDLHFTVKVNVR